MVVRNYVKYILSNNLYKNIVRQDIKKEFFREEMKLGEDKKKKDYFELELEDETIHGRENITNSSNLNIIRYSFIHT